MRSKFDRVVANLIEGKNLIHGLPINVENSWQENAGNDEDESLFNEP